jgi:toxin HigB-1
MEVLYTSGFLREFNKLESSLQAEVDEKIKKFETNSNDRSLKVHKLKGRMKGYWSFSVNYRFRIVFEYDDKQTVALLSVGDHDVYT